VSGVLLVPMLLKEDVVMRNYDFAPLWRSSIGFDRMFDLINNTQLPDGQDNYPPYDIVRTGEETYRIALAVAGFSSDEITVTAQQNLLTVIGGRTEDKIEKSTTDFLYRGISSRTFERKFSLEDHVEVEKASYENGLLQIDLIRRIPEAMKPRRIEIRTPNQSSTGAKSKKPEQVRIVS
jgi:molecular chaperone IbpA